MQRLARDPHNAQRLDRQPDLAQPARDLAQAHQRISRHIAQAAITSPPITVAAPKAKPPAAAIMVAIYFASTGTG